ncbi:thioesterase family protein [Pseudomaricurvus sp. HS19]|uniref:acyl-CoA thioesterase n=1 Tax=Pseudomaricurvus sp. HS19 TaxID=2692626 RepID=UPI00136FF7C7|nr:thioesterase family protein [Pseudomaricurvus sp. HS19]MYM63683.1 acyl-CoA thioesterase [Pseudomaricurvus sp. HS19]
MKLPVVRTKVQTRYSDTDALGHISNSNYVVYLELGRLDFFNEINRQTGYYEPFVVANLNLDYLKECFYGDTIEVVTWCSRVGTKSLTIDAEIYANGKLSAKSSLVSVGFNKTTRQSQALPTDWEASDYNNPA